MPTPTPAKLDTGGSRAKSYGTIFAFVAALGFAVHLLGSETPSTPEPPPLAAPAEPPLAASPRPTPSSSLGTAPNVETLEAELAEDPDAVVRNLTRALPKGEREAQKLKVLEVQALVKSGRLDAARRRARDYFERWPNGPDAATLEALTGVRPRVTAEHVE